MKVTDFTPDHAQALIRLAESAPMQNMAHAKAVGQLLEKFVQWYGLTQQVQPEPIAEPELIAEPAE
jgi:hypothetical protein